MQHTKEDDRLFKKRINELYQRSILRSIPVFTDFLGLNEQNLLSELKIPAMLYGGCASSERKIACFGETSQQEFPIVCIEIKPSNQKFADALSHRDFLGSLTALGLRRETLGDIIIENNCGFVFCLNTVSDFICGQLDTVRHTTVKCKVCEELPDIAARLPEQSVVITASERADALAAAVFGLSRAEAQKLIADGKAFSDGRLISGSSYTAKPGEIISMRGFGRFIFEGAAGQTKKGRIRAAVRIFK